MSKLVILNIGSGDLLSGFPQVTVRISTQGRSLPEQSVGSLPPAPRLMELYRTWQSIYRCLCNFHSLRSSALAAEEDDLLEIDEAGITNVSQTSLDQVSQQLCKDLNTWLSDRGFLKIERHMRSQLHPQEDIRMILETDNKWLRRLPWHKWEVFQDYPKADLSLSQSEYRRRQLPPGKVRKSKIRILAILGNSRNIDVKAEREFLQSLPDAEVKFLVNPSCQEFNTQLWSQLGWDILFFAGHSQTEEQTGRLYINENPTNNSITIEKLEEALKASIERGLMLTIFNSCDGLGLALALERLHIPVVVVMREPVPNRVAQEFLRYFLEAFAVEQLSFNQAMRQSCRKLQGLEEDFPGASWLPISCQNPAIEVPTWLQLVERLHQSLPVNLEHESTDNLILSPEDTHEQEQLHSNAEATVNFEGKSQSASLLTSEQYSSVVVKHNLKVCKPEENLEIQKPNVIDDIIHLKDILQQKQDKKHINIGRNSSNDIVLPDPQKNVSKKHCFLKFDGYDWWIVDEKSTNGTFVLRQEQDPIDVRLELNCQLALNNEDIILIPCKFEQEKPYYWKFVFYDPDVTNSEDNFNLFQPTAELAYSLSQEKLFNIIPKRREEVKLSPKQRKFIHYMTFRNQENNNQPIVCSYEELIKAIWEDSFNHSKNDVITLAGYIRQKIEADSSQPKFLHTVPGRGFFLDIKAIE